MRIACDTGGTFTDLIVEDEAGTVKMYKASTTPNDPVDGVLNSLVLAAEDHGVSIEAFLSQCDLLVHGTTHAINAIITGNTARTAFLTTEGHPDVLVLREGGRLEPFNFTIPYPAPYVPRHLTFEVPERIKSDGSILKPLDAAALFDIVLRLKEVDVEAIAVCLLWAVKNPVHEIRIGQFLEEHLPHIPYTLGHKLNPVLREYRRASATAIDASLKPLMQDYLGGLTSRLDASGFAGRLLVVTSQGGMLEAKTLAQHPIYAINSGPAMAPIAGRWYAAASGAADSAIIADTGGTTYDVSLVRDDSIPKTSETWIGRPFYGHMTGFPSIDIKSVGAGGGSIAHVDSGGVLHVGPQSAGADPGPVCYGKGGTHATLTDACLVLGYLDPEFFLGGTITLDVASATHALAEQIAKPLELPLEEAALAVVDVATENMIQAIAEITVNQGIDPANAVLVGGGGAAGLNSVLIARRLGCPKIVFPETGAALSAAGALMSDLRQESRALHFTASDQFDFDGVKQVLASLKQQGETFLQDVGIEILGHSLEFGVEARYAGQVWELEVSLTKDQVEDPGDLAHLVERFHETHERVFAVRDPGSVVEFVSWSSSVSCRVRREGRPVLAHETSGLASGKRRQAYFHGAGLTSTPVFPLSALESEREYEGAALIETPFTTIVIDQAARFHKDRSGSLIVHP